MSTSFANNSRNNQTDFLPSSIEAEQAVLGAILVDAEALHKVVEHVDAASFFYKKSHQSIFESFLRLSEKNENIDILTASQHLKDHNLLDEIGGRTYLSELADHAPIAANAPYYAKIIKTKSILRHMILAGNEIVELGHHSEEELDKLVDKAEQLIFGLSQSKSKDQLIHIGDLVHESWKILEEREANKNQLSGLTTGFHDFNTLTSGLQKSDLLILAARPAMGKCLHKDSKILLEDGSLKTIEEIYKAQDANLLTLSNDWKFNLTKPSDYIDDGVKPIFKVTTRSGRSITTTLTHPYLTVEGWKKLAELEAGDKVAVPRIYKIFGKTQLTELELQDLIESGREEFTTEEERIYLSKQANGLDYGLSLKSISSSKYTSEEVFLLCEKQLSTYLNRTFAESCWISITESSNIGLFLKSKNRATELQHLLLRFGIVSELKDSNGYIRLIIDEVNSLHKFIEEIGLEGRGKELNFLRGSIPESKQDDSEVYWDEIVSIEHLGSDQVYDLTIAETHNFVANDICVHNTSLALNIAENVATMAKKPVAIFSLEMSREQLVQRLLCSRAEVDSSRVRSGQLHAEDWAKLGTAMSELGEAPIYIDDSGGVSVMELRGKCRRLQAMTNGELGLVVIDYLQLLEGRGNDSRINQISEISRSLKMMARELNVPVMALSQLSRAVEARQDKRPMLSDLRESGCLTADTKIYNPEIGDYIPIIDLVGKTDFPVYVLDQHKKLIKTKARKAFASGKKKVYKVTTYSGNEVKASANHPFLTVEGWKRLDELQLKEFVATARVLNSEANEFIYSRDLNTYKEYMDDEELILLAHMIGDGCYVPNQPYHYTSKDQDCINIVSKMSTHLYSIQCRSVADRNSEGTQALYLPSPYHLTHGVRHPFTMLLEKYGLEKAHGYKKDLPDRLFNCPLSQLSLFVRHLWATDGSINYSRSKSGKKGKFGLSYSSQSLKLIQKLKKLLLRFGIASRISTNPKEGYRDSYQVNITDAENVRLFAQEIGFFGQKQKDYLKLLPILEEVESNPNADVVPKYVWNRVRELLAASEMSHREFQRRLGTAYCGSTLFKSNLSRSRMSRVAAILQDSELQDMAESDIYWDKIKSIELIGEEETYDIEVPEYHNFVAENYILHNSLEQDADIVTFIYRDDYYNPESEKAGIADVIIAKHRSGPTGVIELLFQNNITKFKNPMPDINPGFN